MQSYAELRKRKTARPHRPARAQQSGTNVLLSLFWAVASALSDFNMSPTQHPMSWSLPILVLEKPAHAGKEWIASRRRASPAVYYIQVIYSEKCMYVSIYGRDGGDTEKPM
jgi:hypothetical protein